MFSKSKEKEERGEMNNQSSNNSIPNKEMWKGNMALGTNNIYTPQTLYFMKEANVKCRQIAIYMMNSGVKIEAGAMSYFQGPIQVTTGIKSVGNAIKQAFTSKFTNERFAMPEYTGSGILVLEPSFKHFLMMWLDDGESIICDKGMFFAASIGVDITPVFAGSVSGTLMGGEGVFQQKITGPGLVVLESPVPECEINKVHLENDVLRVDGNFALLRTSGVNMSVQTVSESLVGSAVSGEGLVNVYMGTGDVWLAPTIKVYDALRIARAHGGELSSVDFNTSTGRANPND